MSTIILELAEMKQNLWRHSRDKGRLVRANVTPNVPGKFIQPAGRSKKDGSNMTIIDYFEEQKKDKKEKAKMLESTWELLRTSLRVIEENEEWLITSRMERQMDEPKRMKRWTEEDKTRNKERTSTQ